LKLPASHFLGPPNTSIQYQKKSMANNPKKNYFDLTGQQDDESESTLRLKLKDETAIKQKLFFSLVTLAQELKRLRAETQPLQDAMKYANRSWYEGGMWRPPAILPGVVSTPTKSVLREATTPSGLFFHLVIVTALTRVGISFANQRSLTLDSVLYFAVFWMIWTKDLGYGTRFDTTDLSYEVVNLLTCIAVLMGSLTATAQLDSAGATRVMIMGAFVAILHCLLHLRVAYWFRNANPNSIEADARKHGIFSIAMTLCEAATWILGLITNEPFQRRWIVFLIAIAFSIARFPRTFPNDFFGTSLSFLEQLPPKYPHGCISYLPIQRHQVKELFCLSF
jgi:Bacterial low temperature requirement A protein (LtrA)